MTEMYHDCPDEYTEVQATDGLGNQLVLPTQTTVRLSNFEKVREFMETFNQNVQTEPEFPDLDTEQLRIDLIEEELGELKDACRQEDLVAVADALTDLLYVVYGAGHAFGIDLDKCFEEVHRSNMSKLGEDGKPIFREDGKVLKGPGYSEPDLARVLFADAAFESVLSSKRLPDGKVELTVVDVNGVHSTIIVEDFDRN